MDTVDLTICIYFDISANLFPLKNIVELTDKWSAYVNKNLAYLSYVMIDGRGKQVSKNVKFSTKNLEILYQIERDRKLKNMGLLNLSKGAYLHSRDTDLSVLFSYPMEIFNLYTIKFDFNMGVLNIRDNDGIFEILKELFGLLKNIKATIKYGIVFPMERIKFPGFYAAGISSQELTEEERHKAFIWGNYGIQCKEKVWEVFWGNILTTQHLASDKIIKEIKSIVGENNLNRINEHVFLVTYPLSIFNYENDKGSFNKYRLKLTNLFEKYNLIITE